MQLRELREYCERRGWTVAGEYVDTGISGAKDRRPELDRLMQDAQKRRFDVASNRIIRTALYARISTRTVYSARREADLVMTSTRDVGTSPYLPDFLTYEEVQPSL